MGRITFTTTVGTAQHRYLQWLSFVGSGDTADYIMTSSPESWKLVSDHSMITPSPKVPRIIIAKVVTIFQRQSRWGDGFGFGSSTWPGGNDMNPSFLRSLPPGGFVFHTCIWYRIVQIDMPSNNRCDSAFMRGHLFLFLVKHVIIYIYISFCFVSSCASSRGP